MGTVLGVPVRVSVSSCHIQNNFPSYPQKSLLAEINMKIVGASLSNFIGSSSLPSKIISLYRPLARGRRGAVAGFDQELRRVTRRTAKRCVQQRNVHIIECVHTITHKTPLTKVLSATTLIGAETPLC